MTIDISGLNKATLLAALFNRVGGPAGLGVLQAHHGPDVMTQEDAVKAIEGGDDSTRMFGKGKRLDFDYLYGRCLKVDLSRDEVNLGLFDRDYGQGAFAEVVKELRA